MFEIIEKLCAVCAPTGREEAMRAALTQLVGDSAECRCDNLGNLIVHRPGNGPKLMITAQMDEPTFLVKSSENGFSRLDSVGRLPVSAQLCKRVSVNGKPGVCGICPIHLDPDSDKYPKADSLRFDIPSEPAAGSFATFAGGASRFGKDGYLVKGKASGSRALTAVMLGLISASQNADLWLVFAACGNTGAAGAAAAANSIAPQYAIVLAVTEAQAFAPDAAPTFALPAIDSGAICDEQLAAALKKAAESCGAKTYLPDERPNVPASALCRQAGGIKTASLLLPVRLRNTANEYFRLVDAEGLEKLLTAYIAAL